MATETKPVTFISIGIDPGDTSGWAITSDPDTVLYSGTAETAAERKAVVVRSIAEAEIHGVPLIAVIETWSAGGWGTHSAMFGVAEEAGRWLESLELFGGVQKEDVVRVMPQTWRPSTHGETTQKGKPKNHLKRIAMTFARVEQEDEGEACCIALWAQISFECYDLLEKLLRREAA